MPTLSSRAIERAIARLHEATGKFPVLAREPKQDCDLSLRGEAKDNTRYSFLSPSCCAIEVAELAMEFPLIDLLNREKCTQWIVEHFHPDGLSCPNCKAGVEQARLFRTTRRSQLTVYRCRVCNQTYNLYSGTLLAQHHLRPEQVVLLLRGILKGEPTKSLASELQLNYKTVLTLRHQLQERAEQLQSQDPLSDTRTETDEMFQNAGKKRRQAS